VYNGPARLGYVSVLQRMGADVTVEPDGPGTATIRARSGPLRATEVPASEIPSLDEIPVLAVAAAHARGVSTFADAAELAVKETDRIAATTAMVGAFGGRIEPRADGLVVTGGGRAVPADVDSGGDHRIAMAAAVAALGAEGASRVRGWEAVATSYPGFIADLEALQR